MSKKVWRKNIKVEQAEQWKVRAFWTCRSSQPSYGFRYKNFLGDGDSSSFPSVVASQPYGPDFKEDKLECVGYVQKHIGTCPFDSEE